MSEKQDFVRKSKAKEERQKNGTKTIHLSATKSAVLFVLVRQSSIWLVIRSQTESNPRSPGLKA